MLNRINMAPLLFFKITLVTYAKYSETTTLTNAGVIYFC